MKFLKGMLIGGAVATGIAIMYTDAMEQNKKRMMKKGKRLVKRMGII